jgi:hypothetical protein
MSAASKYLTFAIVDGSQAIAIHFSQAPSPTRAISSNSVQCEVANLMSSHSALASHQWKSWNWAGSRTLPALATSSIVGTKVW